MAKIDIVNVENALQVLECVHILQFEELQHVVSEYIRNKLDDSNCCQILLAAERIPAPILWEDAMKKVVQYFYLVCRSRAFTKLPYVVILKIVKCRELVVRSELDVFVGIMHWLLRIDATETETKSHVNIAKRAYALLNEINLETDEYDDDSRKSLRLVHEHATLLKHVDEDNLSNLDHRRIARFCRELYAKSNTEHNVELPDIQELGERAVDKLISSISSLSTPISPKARVEHGRYDGSFTISYTFNGVQNLISPSSSKTAQTSPEFENKSLGGKWSLRAYFRGNGQANLDKYLSCYIYAKSENSELAKRVVSCQTFVLTNTQKNPLETPKFVKTCSNVKCSKFINEEYGHPDMVPLSELHGIDSATVGMTLYFKTE